MSSFLLSDTAWGVYGSLLFVFCLLVTVAGACAWLLLGVKCLRDGARLIRPWTWRRVDAMVERVEIVQVPDSGDGVRVDYRFVAARPGAPSKTYRGSAMDFGPFPWTQDRKVLADRHRATQTIAIWYAEESPSLRYHSRPNAAWQASKGLLLLAVGLLVLATPVYFLKPAWLGMGP